VIKELLFERCKEAWETCLSISDFVCRAKALIGAERGPIKKIADFSAREAEGCRIKASTTSLYLYASYLPIASIATRISITTKGVTILDSRNQSFCWLTLF
jgi:hypothetical protein